MTWGVWNRDKKQWHMMTWTPETKVVQLMERKETAEMLAQTLGESWEIREVTS